MTDEQTTVNVIAYTARAGRIAVPVWGSPQHQQLLDERQFLLDRLFDDKITAYGIVRLESIRDLLDDIEAGRKADV